MTARSDPSKQITIAQAAQRLHEPYQSTHRRVLCGQLPGTWRDRRWVVDAAAVERLVKELEHDAAGGAE